MEVTQISIGRFHHFHLARQLERHDLLQCIWTGYPWAKVYNEPEIPHHKIHSFPWLYSPYYLLHGRFELANWRWLEREWLWRARETLDHHVASRIRQPTILVAMSGAGLRAGMVAQQAGGYYICDRGSTHIRFQDQLLREEYARWGLVFPGVDSRVMAKEEEEYQRADQITVPSEFVRQSFLQMGVPATKLSKVVYGANLARFQKVMDPTPGHFRVLWVGAVNLRKGFLDLLKAFQELKHPHKELLVVGVVEPEVARILRRQQVRGVIFRSAVANQNLPRLYSSAHVFVLPSLEEGLAMVQGEALACGCPVIATANSGSEDLFSDGVEGFIVPIRCPEQIQACLQQLADDERLRVRMSEAAIKRVHTLGGWNSYGDTYANLIREFEFQAHA